MQAISNSDYKSFGLITSNVKPNQIIFAEDKIQISQIKNKNQALAQSMVEFILDWGAIIISAKTPQFDMVVSTIACEIMQDYYYLSLEEIAHVIKKGGKGEYKKTQVQFTNPYDLPTILDWFKQYDTNERQQIVENKRITESQEHKAEVKKIQYQNANEMYENHRMYFDMKKEKEDKKKEKEAEYRKFKIEYLNKKQQENENN